MSERNDGRTIELSAWIAVVCAMVLAPIAHFSLDRMMAESARANRLGESLVLQWTTELGEGIWWIVPSAIVFVVAALQKRHNLARWAFAMLVAVAASGLFVNGAKILVGKTRPKLWLNDGEFGFRPFTYGYDYASMPSGHATTAGAAAVILALACPRAALVILPVGVGIACTRVAIQAHYLSDILVGLALGMSCALLTIAVWRRRWPASVPRAGQA